MIFLKLGTDPINNLLESVLAVFWKMDFGLVLFSENSGSETDFYLS